MSPNLEVSQVAFSRNDAVESVSEKQVERATYPLRRAPSPPEIGRQVAAQDRLVACSTNFQTGSEKKENRRRALQMRRSAAFTPLQ
jgi:hypothetical protein